MPSADVDMTLTTPAATRKSGAAPEKKYKCQFCNRAFSRSEHRSRHERSRKSRVFLPERWRWSCPAMKLC